MSYRMLGWIVVGARLGSFVQMLVREMSQQECKELLARLGFGRLACAQENRPYIVPIYFASEPGASLWIRDHGTEDRMDAFESHRMSRGR
jgi:nitroimidazol reductase NimA-like FMN-containing flavoprotein (pyridoxamine 5'-phosphate oxidase superfamily)